ncbi:MAG: type II toxin-antitoxin system death-on-curing family toxin [Candidatus Altiarchaeum hamiconexum]|uniref:Type II toxin-antitoxin system death-on-curing family toxin n=1 Tax=Candidatus Altarchaeum hamiconexum TaxID=1803513 RepID=A0A8J7YTI9_9ARCH|nr:type II toxin-antitoxin system death-on-curing family toxin [Candidatus Altarchaeum hamiconexum]OIQ05921.1 MAG: hypothetical protein AUK59_01970 [Candidatus Altarchaeum sp. CG2_30_32_3053]PIN67634.1 MAG: hypothetical protein COV98_02230 [Candidatus Altarchaeum sp. CG12_big_fil_rev_8_21_14_0_65_33_22]PIV27350.1 MAG: hypothetical protein COS36_06090 [Candidatus Altarchaeum sp. CG03_land_8_20_14_0_80_32_618]PIX48720.1 MAG: hypothetical protein COZ53_03200 [Candidatus Altarchaeum sp. CG_4_8_14_3
MKIIVPSVEEIVEINKRLGCNVMNKGMFEFLITKIESTYENKEHIEIIGTIAKIAAIFWMDIIQFHPFVDGNKRTATEAMLLFLKKNNYILETPLVGKVYISLKIANNDIKYDKLLKWLYQRIREKK